MRSEQFVDARPSLCTLDMGQIDFVTPVAGRGCNVFEINLCFFSCDRNLLQLNS